MRTSQRRARRARQDPLWPSGPRGARHLHEPPGRPRLAKLAVESSTRRGPRSTVRAGSKRAGAPDAAEAAHASHAANTAGTTSTPRQNVWIEDHYRYRRCVVERDHSSVSSVSTLASYRCPASRSTISTISSPT